jgi:16S rRNA (uracil1498-N3)-methyltransferase
MLPLFYVAELPTHINERCRLVGHVGHHIARVLRAVPGEEILLSDGKGYWSRVSISGVEKSSVELVVLESGHQAPREVSITVIQGITKGDRTRENIELLVQAGVDRIVPWKASRSIGKLPDGVEKLKIAVIEAGKQSRRYYLPEVADVVDMEQLQSIIRSADLSIVLEANTDQKLSEVVNRNHHHTSIVLIIGPEGGIDDMELEKMEAAGAIPAKLGRTILRSAHAGIAAVSALSVALGLW